MSWLNDVLRPEGPAFALLHRPDNDPGAVDLLTGDMSTVAALADLPVVPGRPAAGRASPPAADVLALVPYRQLAERGFACVDDGTPLRALRVREHRILPLDEVAAALPGLAAPLRDARFDVSDAEYADVVRRVVAEEIGTGLGANFVLKRSLLGTVDGWARRPRHHALSVFGRLLAAETGAHWTFVVCTGDRVLLGASPERHVSLAGGTATMNPISGTLRYPDGARDTVGTVLRFLADGKEVDELYMVLDEELKMMGRICPDGGQVIGPRIRPMARLAHTEYFIEGRTDLDVRQVLRETMFAPTVTGSPLESACRVIARYEPRGRGYYAGALALIGRDAAGGQWLDSAIGIRMADVDAAGGVRVDVGATLVRHSDPDSEAAETRVKAAGLLAAFEGAPAAAPTPTGWRDPRLWTRPEISGALTRRNDDLAGFWLCAPGERARPVPSLRGRRALVVDCEDHFTAMLGSQLKAVGLRVTIRRFDEAFTTREHDLLVMGPGPGDPRAIGDPKIATIRRLLRDALDDGTPLLAVCLSHQVLTGLFGLPVAPLPAPNQGAQHEVEIFGRREHCGFYNTFAASAPADTVPAPVRGGAVHLDRDPATGVVHATRGEGFRSVQFHAESVLTRRGVDLIGQLSAELLHGIPAKRPLQVTFSA